MLKNRAAVLTLIVALLISNVVLLTFLVGTNPWSSDVAIGKAAPRGATIALPSLKSGEILAANRWPDACSFVRKEEIEAIFPGVKDIQQESHPITALSIKEFAAHPSWKEGDRSESGRCLYSMRLPGETYSSTLFWLRIEAVADPKLIAGYVDRLASGTNTRGAAGADRCVITDLAEGSWNCHKGPLLFTVGGQTTVTFKGTPAPAPFVWRDDVLPKFIKTMTAKIK
ncbi:hypothetical protein [Streptomyces sp. NPDC001966]